MTNVAVCISGQPRSYIKGYEYVKRNLLDIYDCDVYIHSWNSADAFRAVDLYQPKKYEISSVPDLAVTEKYTRVPPPTPSWNVKNPAYATYCMLYSVNRANALVDGDYDWVVRTRFDYALNARIPFELLKKDILYVPNCRMTPEHDFCNDQFAFGSRDAMIKYSDTFNNIDEFYDAGVVMIGEDMLSANLKKHGLIRNKLNYCDMNNPFPPGPKNGTPHSLIREDIDQWHS